MIAVYIADKLERGESLEDALRASVADLDGTFAYLISTPEGIGVARDPFALKPLLFAESDEVALIASEEVSIRAVDQRRRPACRASWRPGRCAGGYADLRASTVRGTPRARSTRRSSARRPTGVAEIHLANPAARHCLAVAVMQPHRVVFDGPVGWFCGGMCDGARITVHGNCGWSVGENLMSGSIDVHGNAGSSTGRHHARRAASSSAATPAPAPASR